MNILWKRLKQLFITGDITIPLNGLYFGLESGRTGPALTVGLKASKYTLNATGGATVAAAGDLTGAAYVKAGYSAVGAANLTTRTAILMMQDQPTFQIGDEYHVRIVNTSGGTTTLVGGTGVTITGTATLATNTYRDYDVLIGGTLSAPTFVFQNVGSGAV